MSFNDSYNKIKSLVHPELLQVDDLVCNFNTESLKFNESLKKFLTAPSKRLRPVIAFLYIKAFNKDINEKQINLQAAVELIHNATLIHDDIIDCSDIRRNLPSLNSQFGNSLAVVAGDFLLSLALNKLLILQNFEILNVFSNTIEKMCIGEISQYFNKFKIPTIDVYIEKSKGKTASLFEASLVSAAILSDLDKTKAFDFAENFGIAFQIRDDILNFKQSDEKPVNNDIDDGIYTAPVILAQNLNNLDSGIEKSLDLLDNYLRQAKAIICDVDDNIYKKALLEILDLLKL